jgi:hypothetical protein
VATQPDPGCTTDFPHHIEVSGAVGTELTVCSGVNQLTIQNSSEGLVIEVNETGTDIQNSVDEEPATTPADQAVDRQVPASCIGETVCELAPGATLRATSDNPLQAQLRVNTAYTAAVNAASGISEWIGRRLSTVPAQLEHQVDNCGQDVLQDAGQSNPDANEAVNEALTTSTDCRALYNTVDRTSGEAEEPSAASEIFDSFAERLQHDLHLYAAVELIHALHP